MSSDLSRSQKRIFDLVEVAEMTGIDRSSIVVFIQREWICPLTVDRLDEEDVARVHLIQELRVDFGVNDDAISLILHLMDQLYYLRGQMRKIGSREK